jgi:AcrR family transcriptional regulator
MQRPPRIDFVALVNDLIRAGMTLPEIAAALGVSKGLPYHWLSGGEPGHYNGVLVLALHARRCDVQHIERAQADIRARAKATTDEGDDDGRTEEGRGGSGRECASC